MTRKFKLEIELGNDAMQNSNDVADALIQVRTKLSGYPDAFTVGYGEGDIFDINGNQVGSWQVVEESD